MASASSFVASSPLGVYNQIWRGVPGQAKTGSGVEMSPNPASSLFSTERLRFWILRLLSRATIDRGTIMEDLLKYLDDMVEPTTSEFEKNPRSVGHAFVACVITFHAID
jgi:hypothetical protein